MRLVYRFSIAVITLGLSLSATVLHANPTDPIRDALEPIANKVLVDLKRYNQSNVAVGTFSSPEELNANFGPGITNVLSEILNGLQKDIVDPKAQYSVIGRYEKVVSELAENVESVTPSEMVRVRVHAQLVDENGQLVDGGEATGLIKDNSTIASMLGLTLALPTLANSLKQNHLVLAALKNDGTNENSGVIDGTKMRTRENSPYAVEVVAASKFRLPETSDQWGSIAPCVPRFENNQLYVDLKADQVYALRVYNEGSHDAATIVEIDGLNVFNFSSSEFRTPNGFPKYKFYVIEKDSMNNASANCRIITGWHYTNTQSHSFLVTEYGKGVSAQQTSVAATGKTGTITLSFASAWNEREQHPADAIAARGPVETAVGPVVSSKQTAIERKVGRFNEIITIRYTR